MNDNRSVLPTIGGIFAFWCVAFEVMLLLVSATFGEYTVVGGDQPLQIGLDSYPYGFIYIVTVFALFYACWAAGGTVTERERMGVSTAVRGAAASAMSSILLLGALMLLVNTHLHAQNVLSYTIDSRAYILIGLPIGATVGLLVAASAMPDAEPATGHPKSP